MGIPNTYRIKLFKTTRRKFWYVGWTNFSFQFDEFGNSKTWWNWIIPNKNVGITWRCLCEELSGGYLQKMMGLVLKTGIHFTTILRKFDYGKKNNKLPLSTICNPETYS